MAVFSLSTYVDIGGLLYGIGISINLPTWVIGFRVGIKACKCMSCNSFLSLWGS